MDSWENKRFLVLATARDSRYKIELFPKELAEAAKKSWLIEEVQKILAEGSDDPSLVLQPLPASKSRSIYEELPSELMEGNTIEEFEQVELTIDLVNKANVIRWNQSDFLPLLHVKAITPIRSSMTEENLEKLLFLHRNIKLCNYT